MFTLKTLMLGSKQRKTNKYLNVQQRACFVIVLDSIPSSLHPSIPAWIHVTLRGREPPLKSIWPVRGGKKARAIVGPENLDGTNHHWKKQTSSLNCATAVVLPLGFEPKCFQDKQGSSTLAVLQSDAGCTEAGLHKRLPSNHRHVPKDPIDQWSLELAWKKPRSLATKTIERICAWTSSTSSGEGQCLFARIRSSTSVSTMHGLQLLQQFGLQKSQRPGEAHPGWRLSPRKARFLPSQWSIIILELDASIHAGFSTAGLAIPNGHVQQSDVSIRVKCGTIFTANCNREKLQVQSCILSGTDFV